MPRGICKLCCKDADLQLSHLIGRAVYKLCREDDGDDPIVMTTDVVMKTSRQVRDYVLCATCEERFNKGGEQYVTSLFWRRRNGFPLLDKLRLALPIQREPDCQVFSGERVGINTDKLAYYAMSVIWRSGIHQWKTIGNQTFSVVLSAEEEKRIRRYLLGETALLGNVAVVVTVCTDIASQAHVLFPRRLEYSPGCSIFPFLVRGIDFNVLITTARDTQFGEVCCVGSPVKRIFLSDRTELRLNEVKHFHTESKLARNINPNG